jgi:hypothetical protein
LWREMKAFTSSACWIRPLAFHKARRRKLAIIIIIIISAHLLE